MTDQEPYEAIRLILSEPVQRAMEERLILVEDIQKVIEYAEHSGKRMYNAASGHYLAYTSHQRDLLGRIFAARGCLPRSQGL